MTTYLELVNDAIDEAKISLDPLTSLTFASPPRTAMYNRIKRWVNLAYKELFLARNEWYFRKERTSLTVWPRLHLSGLTTIPVVGDVLTGQTSGVQFTIEAIHTFEDVEEDTATERTFSVSYTSDYNLDDLILHESFTGNPPVGSDYDAGYFKGFGRYDFRSDVSFLETIDPDSVYIFDGPSVAVADRTLGTHGQYVTYVPYEKWHEYVNVNGSYPQYITETPQGTYDLWPRPKRDMLLAFHYTRSVPEMTVYNDVPQGIPEEYHDYLMWRAVVEFADFDNNRALFSRAQKHVNFYEVRLGLNQLPEVKFARSKFDG